MEAFPLTANTVGTIEATADSLFAFLDDHKNLSAHMSKSSWMMLGSHMEIYLDAGEAHAPGSKFGFKGAVLGLPLSVDEVVTEREPPGSKAWQTIGEPHLWVIGRYKMGFKITPDGGVSRLQVFIEYARPAVGLGRFLGVLFGNTYARWCTRRMVNDAGRHFAHSHS